VITKSKSVEVVINTRAQFDENTIFCYDGTVAAIKFPSVMTYEI
jgi:hypothetical protein